MDYEEEDVEAPEAAKGEAQASGMAGASRGAAPQRSEPLIVPPPATT